MHAVLGRRVTGVWVTVRARRLLSCAVISVLSAGLPVLWPLALVQLKPSFTSPGRGVTLAELLSILLAALLPAAQLTRFAYLETSAVSRARGATVVLSAGAMLLPLIPFAAWWLRVRYGHVGDVPNPAPFLAALVAYAALGVVATQLAGPVRGPLLTLVVYGAIVVAQSRWGASFLWGALPTGDVWRVQPALVVVVTVGAVALLVHTRGATLSASPTSDDEAT